MHNRNSGRSPYEAYPLALPLKLRWQTKLKFEIVAQPLVSGDDVYAASISRLYKLNLQTGEVLWEFKTEQAKRAEEHCHMIATPAIWQDRIYLSDESFFVYCLNRDTGQLLWQTQQLRSNNEFICVYQDRLFLKTKGLTSENKPGYVCVTPDGEVVWFVQSEARISTISALVNDILLFGDESGFMYGVQIQDGQIRWRTNLKSVIDSSSVPYSIHPYGSILTVGSTLIVAGSALSLVGIDISTGSVKWQYEAESAIDRKACDSVTIRIYIILCISRPGINACV